MRAPAAHPPPPRDSSTSAPKIVAAISVWITRLSRESGRSTLSAVSTIPSPSTGTLGNSFPSEYGRAPVNGQPSIRLVGPLSSSRSTSRCEAYPIPAIAAHRAPPAAYATSETMAAAVRLWVKVPCRLPPRPSRMPRMMSLSGAAASTAATPHT